MLSAPQAATAANFAGKTIEVIVPSGAGGGLTRNARRFTKNFSKYIPGNPNVIVKNIVGGGGRRVSTTSIKKEKKTVLRYYLALEPNRHKHGSSRYTLRAG